MFLIRPGVKNYLDQRQQYQKNMESIKNLVPTKLAIVYGVVGPMSEEQSVSMYDFMSRCPTY
jgi:hypothetical protein